MWLDALRANHPLMTDMTAWLLAQIIKPPLEYLRKGKWNWGYFFSAGGMPSSHSALLVGTTLGIALHIGFDSPVFALAVAVTMVVVYDAAGVRREAGRHAEKINILIQELLTGHPISDKALREVLGHTPLEVIAGIIVGIIVSLLYWLFVV